MSDDEDYAPEYDEEVPPGDEDPDVDADTDAEEVAGAPVESEEELGVEEDAAGTDLDSDDDADPLADITDADVGPSDNEGPEPEKKAGPGPREAKTGPARGDSRPAAPPKGQPARAEKPRADPLLRASNKPRIVRIVAPDDRRTSNVLQKSEVAHILAMRAKQIATSATFFTDAGGLHDPGAIAFKELADRRCPLVLRRVVGADPEDGAQLVEDWFPNEMAHPQIVAPAVLSAR